MIDTTKTERRLVNYPTLEEIFSDAERLVAAGARTTGNWSLGQILKHVATVMDKSIDGFDVNPPFFMRWLSILFFKKQFLRDGLPSGFKLKGGAAKELLPDESDVQAELEHLRTAVERLKNEPHRAFHPFFGTMTREESDLLNRRHAELHFSFIAEPENTNA